MFCYALLISSQYPPDSLINNMKFPAGRSMRLLFISSSLVIVAACLGVVRYNTIGKQADGSIVIPTGQLLRPAGTHIQVNDRPLGMSLSPDGRTLAVATGSNFNPDALHLIDVASRTVVQTIALKSSFVGVTFNKAGNTIYVGGNTGNDVPVLTRQADGTFAQTRDFAIPGAAPSGLSLSPDEQTLYVALNLRHTLGIIDLTAGTVTQVPVGTYPYSALASPDGSRVYVTNWGGRRPGANDTTDGTYSVIVDPRTGIASSGTVSVVNAATRAVITEIPVGLHPSAMALNANGTRLYVANAHSDTVSVIDTTADRVVSVLHVGIRPGALIGSTPNALALSADSNTLYVADGSNNAIAVVDVNDSRKPVQGLIPTGWFPTAVALSANGRQIFVGSGYGFGSIDPPIAEGGLAPPAGFVPDSGPGRTYRYRYGIVSAIDVPNNGQLAQYTHTVRENTKLLPLSGPEADNHGPMQPIPVYPGQDSSISHVFLIIKENRTYDQVLGDESQANGEPSLVQFGRDVTPNHHALAEQFVLMDNYFTPSDQSALGHRWITQAYAGDWAMKYGNGRNDQNPMLFAPNDFLWDAMKAHGKSVRSFGERGLNTYTPSTASWSDFYNDYVNGTSTASVSPRAEILGLRSVYSPLVAAADSQVPDVVRAKGFLQEFHNFEKNNNLPQLCILLLYNDHTAGTSPGFPTPRAQVADNDLALGQVVDAISHSKYWPQSAIFVTEDDSQDGADHVDGHRSVGLVISPWTKHHEVDHNFYTIINMVRTMEQMIGLPPMNQFDQAADPMFSVFSSHPDPTPYNVLKNQIPLNEMNPPIAALHGLRREMAIASTKMNFTEPDAAPEDLLNHVVWWSVKGYDKPYPGEKTVRVPAFKVVKDSDDK
jgi:YVTN family beta-propeller protein